LDRNFVDICNKSSAAELPAGQVMKSNLHAGILAPELVTVVAIEEQGLPVPNVSKTESTGSWPILTRIGPVLNHY
jgi:hypothetical protein